MHDCDSQNGVQKWLCTITIQKSDLGHLLPKKKNTKKLQKIKNLCLIEKNSVKNHSKLQFPTSFFSNFVFIVKNVFSLVFVFLSVVFYWISYCSEGVEIFGALSILHNERVKPGKVDNWWLFAIFWRFFENFAKIEWKLPDRLVIFLTWL